MKMILRLAIFLLMMTARTGYCWDDSIRIKTVAGERCVFLNDTDLDRITGVIPNYSGGPNDAVVTDQVAKTPDGSQIFVNYYSHGLQKMYFISLQNGAVTRTVNGTAYDVHLGPQDSYVAWAWKHGSEEGLKFSNGEFWDNWGQPIEWVDIVFDPTGRYFSYESANVLSRCPICLFPPEVNA